MTGRLLLAAVAAWACLHPVGNAEAQSQLSIYPRANQSIYPRQGCSPLNPCTTRRVPAPVGNPTDGPLTDSIRRGPLDRPRDPLGLDAELPTIPKALRPQTLPSQGGD
jgi:hypothetical protein